MQTKTVSAASGGGVSALATGTLYLHVGTHKTGTTSIQEAIRQKSVCINAAGIALHPMRNASCLASQFLRSDVHATVRVLGAPLPTLASLDAEIDIVRRARGNERNMLISSELFCMLRTTLEAVAIRATLGAMFQQIVPILFIRNQQDWRESRSDQLRKTGHLAYQMSLPSAHSIEDDWYYEIDAIRAFWQQLGDLRVIDYDKTRKQLGGVIAPFADTIGLSGLFDDLDLRLNPRTTQDPS